MQKYLGKTCSDHPFAEQTDQLIVWHHQKVAQIGGSYTEQLVSKLVNE